MKSQQRLRVLVSSLASLSCLDYKIGTLRYRNADAT